VWVGDSIFAKPRLDAMVLLGAIAAPARNPPAHLADRSDRTHRRRGQPDRYPCPRDTPDALLDVAATILPSAMDEQTQILSVPVQLRRCGREVKMLIDGTAPFPAAKPDARLIKLLIRARRFSTALVGSDGVPFAALARRQGVSPS
jgi:hypothetical protein